MPLKKLTNLEKKQIEVDIKNLVAKKNYLNNLLNERELLLETFVEELKQLKKKYNIKRRTKILKNINQENEIDTINNQILEELINKKTKLSIDNRFYFKKIIYNNYKKLLDQENSIIDNKNIQNFICKIYKNLKIIALTSSAKIVHFNWKSNINNDCKLDNKVLGNINPREIINFHNLDSDVENYLCILDSTGKFKKVFFDSDMLKSNRTFTISKLKNSTKIIDSFIYNQEEKLIILTSIGRIFKFDLSNKYLAPSTRQSQGLILVNLLPTETVVSCCKSKDRDTIYLVSKKGKFFKLKIDEIYNAFNSKLGYINEKIHIKNDQFIKILGSNQIVDIETSKNRSARLNLNKLTCFKNKHNIKTDFLSLEKEEYIENCFRIENLLS